MRNRRRIGDCFRGEYLQKTRWKSGRIFGLRTVCRLPPDRFFAGTLAQAQEKGYDFSGTFLDAEGTETTISEVLSEHPDYHVVIFEEPIQILTESPVLYVSSNVTITSETTGEVTEENINQEVGVVTSEKAYVIY